MTSAKMLWRKLTGGTSEEAETTEDPWVYEAKYPDHYVVLCRKETTSEHYAYPMPGHSRFGWMHIPDEIRKIFIILDKDKHIRYPEDPQYGYYQYFDFSRPLISTVHPGSWCIPKELLTYKPRNDVIFKYFFKGTRKEVKVRQIFCHTELSEQEQRWVLELKDYCRWKKLPWRGMAEPYLLRIAYYAWRKQGNNYLPFAYNHLLRTYKWRAQMFPLNDSDPELIADLQKGIMYWTARDQHLQPLLIVRILKEHSNMPAAEFLKLTVFCFEWAIRYLFVPGKVETFTILFDIQAIGIGDIPMNTLSHMVETLTNEYPYRLDRMWVVHDSYLISGAWGFAKPLLTDVQQEKIKFYRTKEIFNVLRPFFSKHQIESIYGGSRPRITEFFPFPLLPGPFDPDAEGPDPEAIPNCYEAFTEESSIGKFWIDGCRDPLQYSDQVDAVFQRCGLSRPSDDESRNTTPAETSTTTTPSSANWSIENTVDLQAVLQLRESKTHLPCDDEEETEVKEPEPYEICEQSRDWQELQTPYGDKAETDTVSQHATVPLQVSDKPIPKVQKNVTSRVQSFSSREVQKNVTSRVQKSPEQKPTSDALSPVVAAKPVRKKCTVLVCARRCFHKTKSVEPKIRINSSS